MLRIVDANANRALEGVRVCEEIARFHLASPRRFRQVRALRHAIAQAVRRLPLRAVDLAAARASGDDIGRDAPASRVDSLERLLVINLQRTKESLRTLEELTRLIAPTQTAAFQRLRFRAYEVERELLLNVAALRRR